MVWEALQGVSDQRENKAKYKELDEYLYYTKDFGAGREDSGHKFEAHEPLVAERECCSKNSDEDALRSDDASSGRFGH